jgi:hypothetical protein
MARDFPLPPEWRAWVLENLNHDVRPASVVATLMERGLTEAAARREVALVADGYARQLHAFVKLTRELRGRETSLAEATRLDPETFWAAHWEASRPLLLRGLARDWPASSRWSFEAWRRELADLPLEVEVDRAPARHGQGRFVETTLGAFLDSVRTDPDAPDDDSRYAIARNHNARSPAWQGLLADLSPDPAIFDASRAVGGTSLWIGPRGTLTPLHHDATNILFCQLVGRKRFHLVPAHVTELWSHLDSFYVVGDLAAVPDGAPVLDVTLDPGDALFIPAGWFHRVQALDASISYSFMNFRRPNSFAFYAPGALLADPPLPKPR